MILVQSLALLVTFLAFLPEVQGFTTPCVYQTYKCGYYLVGSYGINAFMTAFAAGQIC
jgi:hypothetical protein